MSGCAAYRFLVVGFCLTLCLACTGLGHAGEASKAGDHARLALTELPVEGQRTYALILQGGPFPYDKDGIVFGNRERRLPAHPRGYYREYTVKTPGVKSRGARRIACGGAPRTPEVCYYSDDHYASFRRIVP